METFSKTLSKIIDCRDITRVDRFWKFYEGIDDQENKTSKQWNNWINIKVLCYNWN